MSAEADLIAGLVAWGPLISLRADKVFLNAADEGTDAPYIVVTATHDPVLALFGPAQGDHVTFTVACWGQSADQAELVGDAVQGFVDADDELLAIGRTGGFDEATTMDAAVLTIDRWL